MPVTCLRANRFQLNISSYGWQHDRVMLPAFLFSGDFMKKVFIFSLLFIVLIVAQPGAAMPQAQPPYSDELFTNALFTSDVSGWGYSEGDCQEAPFWLDEDSSGFWFGLLHTSEDCSGVYAVIEQSGVIPPEYDGQTFYVEARGWFPCANVTMDFTYPGGFITDSQASGTGMLVLNGSDDFDLSVDNTYSIWISLDQGCGYEESWLDYVSLTADPGATPTLTPTATITPTATATPTITPTATVTPGIPTSVDIFEIDLPNGMTGQLVLTASAGEVLTLAAIMVLVTIGLFRAIQGTVAKSRAK